MSITENAAYLKGLFDGYELDKSSKEGKIIGALVINDVNFFFRPCSSNDLLKTLTCTNTVTVVTDMAENKDSGIFFNFI